MKCQKIIFAEVEFLLEKMAEKFANQNGLAQNYQEKLQIIKWLIAQEMR